MFGFAGPLTMQPMTATLSALDARDNASSTPASVVDVILDVPRQFLEGCRGGAPAAGTGRDQRHENPKPHGLQQFLRDLDLEVRSPPGSGVSETRIVSPMPCCSKMPIAADEATMPFEPMPASVRPRWMA